MISKGILLAIVGGLVFGYLKIWRMQKENRRARDKAVEAVVEEGIQTLRGIWERNR